MVLLKKIITYYAGITVLIFSFDYTVKLDCSELEWGLSTRKGRREAMEDQSSVGSWENLYFFEVYDGHGGFKAARYAKNNLFRNFSRSKSKTSKEKLTCAFLKTDKNFLNKHILDRSGTTAVVAVVNAHTKKLCIANTGDSRAIVIRDGKVLLATKDHKPDVELERKRIKDSGGEVSYRNGCWRVNGSLAVSRAIGDKDLKEWVIPDPDISEVSFCENDILVLACDGVWDVMSSEEVSAFVQKSITKSVMNDLVNEIVEEDGNDDQIKLIAQGLRDEAY